MHLKRTEASRRWPVPRKGTKYLARAKGHVSDGVPIVVAVRDMLKMAKTSKEVKYMVKNKMIKLNGKEVRNIRESVRFLSTLELGKKYVLDILPTGRFSFEESKKSGRLCRVSSKKVLRGNKIQLNLHDGTNVLTSKKINVGDSVELDDSNKVKNVFAIEKGKKVFITSGRNIGLTGKIKEVESGEALIKFDENDREVVLDLSHIIAR